MNILCSIVTSNIICEKENSLDLYRDPFIALCLSTFFCVMFTPLVRRYAISSGAIDDPNVEDRKIHKMPIPRWGGISILFSTLLTLFLLLPSVHCVSSLPPYIFGIAVCGFLISLVGAYDDRNQLSAKVQALFLLSMGVLVQYLSGEVPLVQITITNDLLKYYFDVDMPAINWIVTALYIFIITKTMDTIDGLDGLAAGLSAIAGITLVLLSIWFNQPVLALISASVAGSALGFLRHNFNPAKIFLGTAGSQLLGFLLAVVTVAGPFDKLEALMLLIPLLVFGIPLFDACNVIVRRVAAKESITKADKRHIHHQLLNLGLSQKQVVSLLYVVAICMCALLLILIFLQEGRF